MGRFMEEVIITLIAVGVIALIARVMRLDAAWLLACFAVGRTVQLERGRS